MLFESPMLLPSASPNDPLLASGNDPVNSAFATPLLSK